LDNDALPKSALLVPHYRRYFVASIFITFGLWTIRFLIGWEAWSLTESAFWVGVVSGIMLVPTFILSPPFGVLADRIKLRLGLLITTTLLAIIGFAIALSWWMQWLTIEVLTGLALAKGIVMAAHHPLRFAMLPHLVPKRLLPSGVGTSSILFNVSRIVAPALAALLLTLSSSGMVFALSALMFAAGTLSLTRLPDGQGTGNRDARLLNNLREGFYYAIKTPTIRLLLLLAALNGFLGRALVELLPAVSGQLLNGTAQTLAFLTALAGLGSILAGVIIARQRDKQQRFVNIILGSLATTGLLMYALLLPTSLTLVAIVITLLALTMTLVSAGCQAMTQVSVSDAFRGRVMSFWAVIAMGVPAIGAFVLGGMAELMGFPVALSILGTLVLAAVIAVKRKRHLWSNGQQQDVA